MSGRGWFQVERSTATGRNPHWPQYSRGCQLTQHCTHTALLYTTSVVTYHHASLNSFIVFQLVYHDKAKLQYRPTRSYCLPLTLLCHKNRCCYDHSYSCSGFNIHLDYNHIWFTYKCKEEHCNNAIVILTILFVIWVARYRYRHMKVLCMHPLRPEQLDTATTEVATRAGKLT